MELLSIILDEKLSLIIKISPIISIFVILVFVTSIYLSKRIKNFKVEKLNIKLGNVGSVDIKPNSYDLQIAHRIWTELVTRKAAIVIDIENDVIIEIYNSWYELFKQVRHYISELPADMIKKNKSTRKIVDIAIDTLNLGLRPHLTTWQAKFRYWYDEARRNETNISPQELQKKFPEYTALVNDIMKVNSEMIEYANELKKLLT